MHHLRNPVLRWFQPTVANLHADATLIGIARHLLVNFTELLGRLSNTWRIRARSGSPGQAHEPTLRRERQ